MADTKQGGGREIGKRDLGEVESNQSGGVQSTDRRFGGRLITAANKNKIYGEYFNHFLSVEAKNEEFREVEAQQLVDYAHVYAGHHIRKEQAHLKAYTKGKKVYTYKNIRYPVVTFSNPQYASEQPEIQEIVRNLVSNEEE